MVNKHIKVFARIKPTSSNNQINHQIETCSEEDQEVLVLRRGNLNNHLLDNKIDTYAFPFQKVFSQNSTQEEIFKIVVHPVIDKFLDGSSGALFAYGQTGTGKTFLMTGNNNNPGIIQLSFVELFQRLPCYQFTNISYYEIYNEKVYDLLCVDETEEAVTLHEDPNIGFCLKNLSVHPVNSITEALLLLSRGEKRRSTAETSNNSRSSRSHAVFVISNNFSLENEIGMRRARLSFVDLAGSENVHKMTNNYQCQTEAKYINLSLHYLEQVIISLGDAHCKHVPYRNSIMTAILKDCLGGGGVTSMVTTLSTDDKHMEETLQTCRFAQRVSLVTSTYKINHILDPATEIEILREENRMLKLKLSNYVQITHGPHIQNNLSDNEKLLCEEKVDQFLTDRITSRELEEFTLKNVNRINYCFTVLKKEIKQENYVEEIQQRDKEINFLLHMVNQTATEEPSVCADLSQPNRWGRQVMKIPVVNLVYTTGDEETKSHNVRRSLGNRNDATQETEVARESDINSAANASIEVDESRNRMEVGAEKIQNVDEMSSNVKTPDKTNSFSLRDKSEEIIYTKESSEWFNRKFVTSSQPNSSTNFRLVESSKFIRDKESSSNDLKGKSWEKENDRLSADRTDFSKEFNTVESDEISHVMTDDKTRPHDEIRLYECKFTKSFDSVGRTPSYDLDGPSAAGRNGCSCTVDVNSFTSVIADRDIDDKLNRHTDRSGKMTSGGLCTGKELNKFSDQGKSSPSSSIKSCDLSWIRDKGFDQAHSRDKLSTADWQSLSDSNVSVLSTSNIHKSGDKTFDEELKRSLSTDDKLSTADWQSLSDSNRSVLSTLNIHNTGDKTFDEELKRSLSRDDKLKTADWKSLSNSNISILSTSNIHHTYDKDFDEELRSLSRDDKLKTADWKSLSNSNISILSTSNIHHTYDKDFDEELRSLSRDDKLSTADLESLSNKNRTVFSTSNIHLTYDKDFDDELKRILSRKKLSVADLESLHNSNRSILSSPTIPNPYDKDFDDEPKRILSRKKLSVADLESLSNSNRSILSTPTIDDHTSDKDFDYELKRILSRKKMSVADLESLSNSNRSFIRDDKISIVDLRSLSNSNRSILSTSNIHHTNDKDFDEELKRTLSREKHSVADLDSLSNSNRSILSTSNIHHTNDKDFLELKSTVSRDGKLSATDLQSLHNSNRSVPSTSNISHTGDKDFDEELKRILSRDGKLSTADLQSLHNSNRSVPSTSNISHTGDKDFDEELKRSLSRDDKLSTADLESLSNSNRSGFSTTNILMTGDDYIDEEIIKFYKARYKIFKE